MLSREMRNNDWRINGLERKLNTLNTKINDLLEEGGGDNTGGSTGGGKLTFKLNENIRYYGSVAYDNDPAYRVVYITTQTFNGTPTSIDGVDAIYNVTSSTDFGSSYLDDILGGDWRFLSSDYTIRVGDTLYTTDGANDGSFPPYTIATMETDNGSPRTIFTAYSDGYTPINNTVQRCVRTIGTPAAIRTRFIPMNGNPRIVNRAGNYFEVTTDFFGTAATEEYVNKGILQWSIYNARYELTNNRQLLDSVTSNMYMMIMASGVHVDAFELSYH